MSYNVLGNHKEYQEGRSDQYCLPVPLHGQGKHELFQVWNNSYLQTGEKLGSIR
jgi:hypothetical protein